LRSLDDRREGRSRNFSPQGSLSLRTFKSCPATTDSCDIGAGDAEGSPFGFWRPLCRGRVLRLPDLNLAGGSHKGRSRDCGFRDASKRFAIAGSKPNATLSQRCWLLPIVGLPNIGKISQRTAGRAPWTALVRSDPIRPNSFLAGCVMSSLFS